MSETPSLVEEVVASSLRCKLNEDHKGIWKEELLHTYGTLEHGETVPSRLQAPGSHWFGKILSKHREPGQLRASSLPNAFPNFVGGFKSPSSTDSSRPFVFSGLHCRIGPSIFNI